MLQYIVNMVAAGDPVLHLYSNDLTPGESTPGEGSTGGPTESIEAGYAAITLTAANWTTTQASGVTTAEYIGVTFSFTTGAGPYGYYVTDTSNGMLWIERFSGAPFTLPTSGGDIAITPKITLD
jgi:hypothetical protein